MKSIINSVKGTRDFYPQEMALRTWLYNKMRTVAESFGYQEYEAPLLESIDLYAAKSGEELVKEQSFVFSDRSGDYIALRPELTPSLARMVAQRQNQLIYPLRWWSYGPFWRYERPQKGRTREFFQWNVDFIGTASPEADAELIAILATFFRYVGLEPKDIRILVNNRRLMDQQFNILGVPDRIKADVLRLIDRRDKLNHDQWHDYAQEIGLNKDQIAQLILILQDDQLWEQSEELVRLFPALEALQISEYVQFAPHIIRGLDYYTGTVFEAWDVDGEFRAIMGGGRYDDLVSDVGGSPLPGVGFAMGDVVLALVLKKFGCIPAGLGEQPAPVMVTVFDEETLSASYRFASELRHEQINVVTYPEASKLAKQFKFANRIGARATIVLGPDELAQGTVVVKDMVTGTQSAVMRESAAAYIRKLLEANSAS
jgi:histidyl-tRNA synthetase